MHPTRTVLRDVNRETYTYVRHMIFWNLLVILRLESAYNVAFTAQEHFSGTSPVHTIEKVILLDHRAAQQSKCSR